MHTVTQKLNAEEKCRTNPFLKPKQTRCVCVLFLCKVMARTFEVPDAQSGVPTARHDVTSRAGYADVDYLYSVFLE